MAFWGVEVKCRQPVTHSFRKEGKRLRITRAILHKDGWEEAGESYVVCCQVGRKSPVPICVLHASEGEWSCGLNLEFEEAYDDVVFSIAGSLNGTISLVGYYVGRN